MEKQKQKRRARERIRELRERHIKLWLELMNFSGDFEHNAADFISFKLGFTDAYLRAVILGNRDLGIHTALKLNAMLPRGGKAKEFDYKVLTTKVRDILKITEDEMAHDPPLNDCFEDAIPVDAAMVKNGPPGVDKDGRPQIFIVLSDGQVYLVKLPNGAQIDSVPWVASGEAGETGTCGFQWAKAEE